MSWHVVRIFISPHMQLDQSEYSFIDANTHSYLSDSIILPCAANHDFSQVGYDTRVNTCAVFLPILQSCTLLSSIGLLIGQI